MHVNKWIWAENNLNICSAENITNCISKFFIIWVTCLHKFRIIVYDKQIRLRRISNLLYLLAKSRNILIILFISLCSAINCVWKKLKLHNVSCRISRKIYTLIFLYQVLKQLAFSHPRSTRRKCHVRWIIIQELYKFVFLKWSSFHNPNPFLRLFLSYV